MLKPNFQFLTAVYISLLLGACGGGGGGSTPTPTPVVTSTTLTSFTPATGAAGTAMTLTGTKLDVVTDVLFTGPAPSTTSVSGGIASKASTTLATTVPTTLSAGDYTISVVYPGGEAVAANKFTVTVVGGNTTPTVTGFSPNTGAAGTVVTITGTNLVLGFPPAPTVKFGTTNAGGPYTNVSNTGVTFTVPAGLAVGTHTLTIGGMSGVPMTVGTFTVTAAVNTTPTITSFTPATGAVSTSMTITGANLSAVTDVLFTGPSPSTAFVSGGIGTKTATSITTTVPASLAAGSYTVSIVHPVGEVAATGGFTVTAVPVVTVPAAPTGLNATAISPTQIDLSWTAVAGATSYNIYRGAAVGFVAVTASKINTTTISTASFNDIGLTATTQYFYKVTAINATGESFASVEVSATTGGAAGLANGNGIVTTIAGLGGGSGGTAGGKVDGTGTAARFHTPMGIAVDVAGNLYVADSSNYTIRKITQAGVVTTVAGATVFNRPQGIAVDVGGNLYVADTYNHIIRKIDPTGMVTIFAGASSCVYPYGVAECSADGTGTAARFNTPAGITIDASGNLYVADSGNNTIRKITQAGVVTTLAGSAGVAGSLDGTGTAARFSGPQGIVVDATGNLYVAGYFNQAIRKITQAGVVTTLAGSAGIAGSLDGTGTAAQFNLPRGITIDATGNLYVADTYNSTIRKITPAGVVSTIAGSAGVGGSLDGTGTAARFSWPQGIVVDATGNLYVTESFCIRKIQ